MNCFQSDDRDDYDNQYQYGLQKRHYPTERKGVTYPVKKSNFLGDVGFEYSVVDYSIKKRLPKKCPFDVMSYDGYSIHLRTDAYDAMDDLPRSRYLCPQGLVSVGVVPNTDTVVELTIIDPAYFGLGEWSEWPDVVHALSAIEDTINEQIWALETLGEFCCGN
jgi:hypothetical protein